MTGPVEIELPRLEPRAWRGVLIERGELAGSTVFAVTTIDGMTRAPRRRWFPDRTLVLLHGADQADAGGLPLFDRTLTAGGAE